MLREFFFSYAGKNIAVIDGIEGCAEVKENEYVQSLVSGESKTHW